MKNTEGEGKAKKQRGKRLDKARNPKARRENVTGRVE